MYILIVGISSEVVQVDEKEEKRRGVSSDSTEFNGISICFIVTVRDVQ